MRARRQLTAIGVKSGRARDAFDGMADFTTRFRAKRSLVVGTGGIPIDEFLSRPVDTWVR